jgi:hypothetical protein
MNLIKHFVAHCDVCGLNPLETLKILNAHDWRPVEREVRIFRDFFSDLKDPQKALKTLNAHDWDSYNWVQVSPQVWKRLEKSGLQMKGPQARKQQEKWGLSLEEVLLQALEARGRRSVMTPSS